MITLLLKADYLIGVPLHSIVISVLYLTPCFIILRFLIRYKDAYTA